MARILVVNPIVREEDVPRHVPYGEAMLAALAVKHGHQVAVLDCNAHRIGLHKVGEAALADDWDVIAIGGLTTTYSYIKGSCQAIKKANPKALLVAGGGFLTSMPLDIFRWIPEIDVGIVGEAFVTWIELLKKVDEKDFDFSKMLGVIWRDASGGVLNEARPVIHDLDSLPHPAFDLFPMETYFKNSSSLFSEEAHLAQRRIDINGSFGCSLICRYCWHLGTTGDMLVENNGAGNDVVFTYGRNLRYHSPRYIVEMVAELKRSYGIDFANFLDENLMTMEQSSGRKWLGEICDEWDKSGLTPVRGKSPQPGVFWSGTSHASLHRPDVLRKMREAGCTHLVYGLESFDPNILKRLGKGSSRENNISSVGICLESGIIPIPNIIIGFPEETFQSIRHTITALIELGIHAKPHFATAYPGSEWYSGYKHYILDQYAGNLEAYIQDLGDATKITGTISHQFTGMELLGLQAIVAARDLRLLDMAEKAWTPRKDLAAKRESFNFRPTKQKGPIERIPVVVA
jgi:anaerobic magnesium-protoporphyrin IX monomethyl ester cyclase